MTRQEKSDFVAKKARETFMAIRNLRKTKPQFTRAQKDELEREMKELQDEWWNEVKICMRKDKEDEMP